MANLRRTFRVAGTILLLFAVGWFIYTQRILNSYQQNVLTEAILFGKDVEMRRDFKVDLATTYLIGLDVDRALPFSLENPTPPDGFSTHFRVESGAQILLEGDNNSNPRRPKITTANTTTRLLGSFFAEPEQTYRLTFRLSDVAQNLAGIKGRVLILTDFANAGNKATFMDAKVKRFLAFAVAALGLLFALLSFKFR